MPPPEVDRRIAEHRHLDDEIAAEEPLAPLELSGTRCHPRAYGGPPGTESPAHPWPLLASWRTD